MRIWIPLIFCLPFVLFGQTAIVSGLVTDLDSDEPIELVTVYVDGIQRVAETDSLGAYELTVPSGRPYVLVFTRIGYKGARFDMDPSSTGERRIFNIALAPAQSQLEVVVTESRIEDAGVVREEARDLKLLPSTSGNLESVLPHIALGTSSGTGGELTSQYNVRGGNYDENLVYVNDFEIYRPQLIRAGQQEGLSFANIDLIQDLIFSSGGFAARYGDKQSSVLDIRYKRPDSLRASASMSVLGASGHLEGSLPVGKEDYQKFRYLVGARYKTTKYLLGSLDVEGEYTPNFWDLQTYLTWDITRNWQVGLLANYNRSRYEFEPRERETATGLIDFALQLRAVFEGGESDEFTTGHTGLSLTYIPERNKNPFFLKWMGLTYFSDERERFDITGAYRLSLIETDFGEDTGEEIALLGTGEQQLFTRNLFHANVSNFEHLGGWELNLADPRGVSSHFLQWSIKYQYESIFDKINEWERLDSAGYSLPFNPFQVLLLRVLKSRNELISHRFSAYFQDTYTRRIPDEYEIQISGGIRASYWSMNEEFFLTPRVQLLYKPLSWSADMSFRFAAGLYYQPPFYREMRDPQGVVNTGLQSQKSLHLVAGLTWDFDLGRNNPTPFRLISEIYYKALWDQVSYEIENVRIRYSGANDAKGYVAGLDLRLNGEFVPGAESWVNLSIFRARERLDGIQHLEREVGQREGTPVKDVPRPTDQFLSISTFFQDYLPKNENFKVHVNLTVGTGLPFGILGNNKVYRNTYRFPAYHRVDLGFSVLLWDRTRVHRRPRHPLRFTRNTWFILEVFNMMGVENVASNIWIKDIFNVQYAIPNFLTTRRINARVKVEF